MAPGVMEPEGAMTEKVGKPAQRPSGPKALSAAHGDGSQRRLVALAPELQQVVLGDQTTRSVESNAPVRRGISVAPASYAQVWASTSAPASSW
ncbi:MAG: hypothetical protein IPJ65_05580 [Archangiaceae bacterium]|nr:hypothetical protein [Archangiaceae bacterium]